MRGGGGHRAFAFRPIEARRGATYHHAVTEPADGDGAPGDLPGESKDPPGEPAEPVIALPRAELSPASAATVRAPHPRAKESRGPNPAIDPSPSVAELATASTASTSAFPDDGPIAGWLRRADHGLGVAEQAVLVLLLTAVVVTAATAALSDRVLGVRLGRWWFDIVRGGTFSIAMIGAVFASHQQRHLAMDLVSRRLPPRGRPMLRVMLALFTVLVAALLVRSGLHQLDTVGDERGEHLISTHAIVMFMPIGAVLIIAHTVLHMVIDVEYLVRRRLPPERARSGH
jgi:TRAP-type C4-dicarboxylate transport system permease small subunit